MNFEDGEIWVILNKPLEVIENKEYDCAHKGERMKAEGWRMNLGDRISCELSTVREMLISEIMF